MLTHKSNAEELIAKVPPVEVDDHVAMCYVRYIFKILRVLMITDGVTQLNTSHWTQEI
jgi:hypothetical protein